MWGAYLHWNNEWMVLGKQAYSNHKSHFFSFSFPPSFYIPCTYIIIGCLATIDHMQTQINTPSMTRKQWTMKKNVSILIQKLKLKIYTWCDIWCENVMNLLKLFIFYIIKINYYIEIFMLSFSFRIEYTIRIYVFFSSSSISERLLMCVFETY